MKNTSVPRALQSALKAEAVAHEAFFAAAFPAATTEERKAAIAARISKGRADWLACGFISADVRKFLKTAPRQARNRSASRRPTAEQRRARETYTFAAWFSVLGVLLMAICGTGLATLAPDWQTPEVLTTLYLGMVLGLGAVAVAVLACNEAR